MSKKSNSRKSKKGLRKKRGDDPITLFKREMYLQPNSRAGISSARKKISASDIPLIHRELSKDSRFQRNIFELKFPRSIEEYVLSKRLEKLDLDREFMWSAATLANFSEELSRFATLRDEFEYSFLHGQWGVCEDTLDQIETSFGVSIWHVGRKLQLLQMTSGLSAQKDFLESILSTEGLSSLLALLFLYFSLRCEDSVNLETLESELHSLEGLPADLLNYFRFQICPYHLDWIDDPVGLLSISEPHCVIDRYMCYLWMAELAIARYGTSASQSIFRSLELLEDVKDARYEYLFALGQESLNSFQVNPSIDSYTLGYYDQVVGDSVSSLEVKARSLLFSDTSEDEYKSPFEEICVCMGEVLCVSESYTSAKSRLKKLALLTSHMPVSVKISSFIERDKENAFDSNAIESELVNALQSRGNPLDLRILDQEFGLNFLTTAKSGNPKSAAIALQDALHLDYDAAKNMLDSMSLPEYRKLIYEGHISFRAGKVQQAIDAYRSAAEHDIEYVISRSSQFLFRVLLTERRYQECIQHVVEHYLGNPSVSDVYPIELLAKAAIDIVDIRSEICLAIFFSIASRKVGSSWERELSDIYENILHRHGVSRPTGLKKYVDEFGAEELIYFLRYVCVQRIFDDTTAFETMEEIEKERIDVCRWLMDLDPKNADIYASELRSIVREEEIHKRLDEVNASKIYVDEDGILSAADEMMRSYYDRFQELTGSPDLNIQAIKITRLLNELLRKSDESLSEIRLPASEREGLIGTMLEYFGHQFTENPAYGLDTNISTSIRHGAFEGYTRRSFSNRGLLCEYEADGTPRIPVFWASESANFSDSERRHFLKCLERFTKKLENEIREYLDSFLRIRTFDNEAGMFDFSDDEDGVNELLIRTNEVSTYSEFVSNFLAYFWSLTEKSLLNIQDKLKSDFMPKVDQAAETLIASVERKISREKITSFIDAVVSAKTEFQNIMTTVVDWFCKPGDRIESAFDYELALDVALRQVELCYQQPKLNVSRSFSEEIRLKGIHFVGSSEVLFILLQNVARHSGRGAGACQIDIEVSRSEEALRIDCFSEISKDIDLGDIRAIAARAEENYKQDTALKLARREGGSGLSKVWRILEHDYKCDHACSLTVKDDYTFQTTLTITGSHILE